MGVVFRMNRCLSRIPGKMNIVVFFVGAVALVSWYFGTWSYKHFISSPLEKVVCQQKCDFKNIKDNKTFNTIYRWKDKSVELKCECP